MDKEKINSIITKHLQDLEEWGGGKGYRVFHTTNVADIALKIAKEENLEINEDALYLAGISHDLRKDEVFKYGIIVYTLERYIDIDSMSVEYLKEFYKDLNFENDFLEFVALIINEKDSENPTRIESRVLFDADELVNLGLLPIWRQFTHQTYAKHTMIEAIDEWFNVTKFKQEKIIADLKFDYSKKLAKKRFERCDEFFRVLKQEIEVEDI